MKTKKGTEIERKVNELTDKFKNYARSLFDEWTNVVPQQIQEKIAYPLFTVNSDKIIDMNFAKEVSLILFFSLYL